jgi:hypothetical protein
LDLPRWRKNSWTARMTGNALCPAMFEDPQEIANRAWKKLGADMGFVWDSAGPGADDHSFFADAIE